MPDGAWRIDASPAAEDDPGLPGGARRGAAVAECDRVQPRGPAQLRGCRREQRAQQRFPAAGPDPRTACTDPGRSDGRGDRRGEEAEEELVAVLESLIR